ncbi:MAG: glycosyltransferase, partial [Lachnospiraceae bacterium]|nr:glycosyltransferase [Lachnospiraceae bacterium]
MNKIAAIVVTYNRVLLLTECVEALIKYAEGADILIIDNNSTDNTKETIRPYVDNKRVFYYNTGANLGGAGGFNYGMKVAYEKGYDYFWLMDDDTIVEKSTLEELVKAIDMVPDSKFGYLSSIAYWIDGSICVMNDQTPTNDI